MEQYPITLRLTCSTKKEKATSTYLDMHSLSSVVAWNMPVCFFFLVPGCKTISRAAPLHTRAPLPRSSQRFSRYIFFGQFSSQYSIWSDSVHKYTQQIINNLSVLSHLDCVLCPKKRSIAYFPCVVLSSHCITVKPLKPSLKTDPDMRYPVDITATIMLYYP